MQWKIAEAPAVAAASASASETSTRRRSTPARSGPEPERVSTRTSWPCVGQLLGDRPADGACSGDHLKILTSLLLLFVVVRRPCRHAPTHAPRPSEKQEHCSQKRASVTQS